MRLRESYRMGIWVTHRDDKVAPQFELYLERHPHRNTRTYTLNTNTNAHNTANTRTNENPVPSCWHACLSLRVVSRLKCALLRSMNLKELNERVYDKGTR